MSETTSSGERIQIFTSKKKLPTNWVQILQMNQKQKKTKKKSKIAEIKLKKKNRIESHIQHI